MEARADHDFTATNEDELSFTKGSILKILNKDEDPHWFSAELEGREGFVPSNYIRMHDHSWYLGKISRNDAEVLLREKGTYDGAFLVRQCESTPGDFSISVKFQKRILHFKILRDDHGSYSLWNDQQFNSINELVDYHKSTSVSPNQNILLRDVGVEAVQAKFDFNPSDARELAFRKGEIITLINKGNGDGWWNGEINNRVGSFPANYVVPFNRER